MRLEELVRLCEERVKGRFYGKYAGVVTDTADPLEIGRLRARVPAVLGEQVESGWALPCAPVGGGKDRGFLFLPEPGDTVWIEFAGGDPSHPIWTGTFWGAPESTGQDGDLGEATGSEVPTSEGNRAGPGRRILKTKAGHRIVLDDDGDVVVIAHGKDKAEIRLTASGEVILKAEKVFFGSDGASQPVILGDDFKTFFDAHTHPTGVGPSGPPTQPMKPNLLSQKTKTE